MTFPQKLLVLLRLSLSWIFLWSFLDKLPEWLAGKSPAAGFLLKGSSGPFAYLYQSLAGNSVVDWLYMLGLLGLGLALLLGVALRLTAFLGTIFLLLIYSAALPPEHNPFMDEHIIYSLLLMYLATTGVGDWYGLGRRWSKWTKNNPWLQ